MAGTKEEKNKTSLSDLRKTDGIPSLEQVQSHVYPSFSFFFDVSGQHS